MELSNSRVNPISNVRQLEAAGDDEALLSLLNPATPVVVRRAAARSLFRIVRPEFTTDLATQLLADSDRGVRYTLAQTLGRLADDRALEALLLSLKDRELLVREATAIALSRYNSPAAYQALLAGLRHKTTPLDWMVRRSASEALGHLGDRRAVPALIEALRDTHDLVRPAAAQALGSLGDTCAVPALKRARHAAPHRRGAECAECAAIDKAIALLVFNKQSK